MATDILSAARRERDELQKELEGIPAFRKFVRVTALIEEYAVDEDPKRKAINPPPARYVKAVSQPVPSRENSKLAQVEKVVIDYMVKTGRRYSSGQLLPILKEAGLEMGGKVPSKTLASMLSNSSKLNNLKGFGYGPQEWGDGTGGLPQLPLNALKAPAGSPASASNSSGSGDE
jgi:hypothetical protein